MGVERLPSGKFDLNELVLELTMIAYSILRMLGPKRFIKVKLLPKRIVARKRIQYRSPEYSSFCRAAYKLHARQLSFYEQKQCTRREYSILEAGAPLLLLAEFHGFRIYHNIPVNDKRVLRICRKRGIKSTIKYSNHGCTKQASNPQYIAENLLNREFHADKPNEKWLTDVTGFKWYEGIEEFTQDLSERYFGIWMTTGSFPFVIRDRNDNPWVFLKPSTRLLLTIQMR